MHAEDIVLNPELRAAYGKASAPLQRTEDGTYLLEAESFSVTLRATQQTAHFLARAIELHRFQTRTQFEAFLSSLAQPCMDAELLTQINAQTPYKRSNAYRMRELEQVFADSRANMQEVMRLRAVIQKHETWLDDELFYRLRD